MIGAVPCLHGAASLDEQDRMLDAVKMIRRREQAGQAAVLALAMLVIGSATIYFVFNSGQQLGEKTKLTDTADAVAYSVGVTEARSLNLNAYINRAMVANEVAIAQTVSLMSWYGYATTTVKTIDDVLKMFLPWTAIAYGIVTEIYSGMESAQGIFEKAVAADISANQVAITYLKISQAELNTAMLIPAAGPLQKTADMVARLNDPDVKVDPILTFGLGGAFVSRYSGDERKRLKEVTLASRDSFTANRGWGWSIGTLLPWGVPGMKSIGLEKRGGTDLIGYDTWKAVDTDSVHMVSCGWSHGWFKHYRCSGNDEIIPVGWGAASVASSNGNARARDWHGGSFDTNPMASSRAQGSNVDLNSFFSGLPEFYDLSDRVLKDKANDPVESFGIRVTKKGADLITSAGKSAAKPTGRLDRFHAAEAKGVVAAISRVEVYFSRPETARRADGRQELASLFNPYWQVRLASPTLAQRTAAALLQGGVPLP